MLHFLKNVLYLNVRIIYKILYQNTEIITDLQWF